LRLHWTANYLLRGLNALGWLLLYSAVFLYEDQEGRIQNRIVQWWIKVDDARIVSHSRAAAFLQAVARLTVRGFDRVLGERLISFRFAGVSLCLSIVSGLLATVIGAIRAHQSVSGPLLLSAGFVALALLPAFDAGRWVRRFWGLIVIATVLRPLVPFLLFLYSRWGVASAGHALGLVALAFGVSFVCDVCYVTLTRWMLRRIAVDSRVHGVVLMIAVNFLLLCVLLVGPIEVGSKLFKYWQHGSEVIFFSFLLNAIDLFAGSAALILGLTLLIHRLLWPLLERPLYALQRYRVMSDKKLLWGVGLSLAFLPTHMTFDFVKVVLAKFA
jgi:hypothetical protein